MLRQIEWKVQNGPITKNRVLPITTFFFEIFVSANEPLIKSRLDVQVTQMLIFVLFVSAGDLFKVAIYCECPSFQVTLDHKLENQR